MTVSSVGQRLSAAGFEYKGLREGDEDDDSYIADNKGEKETARWAIVDESTRSQQSDIVRRTKSAWIDSQQMNELHSQPVTIPSSLVVKTRTNSPSDLAGCKLDGDVS